MNEFSNYLIRFSLKIYVHIIVREGKGNINEEEVYYNKMNLLWDIFSNGKLKKGIIIVMIIKRIRKNLVKFKKL